MRKSFAIFVAVLNAVVAAVSLGLLFVYTDVALPIQLIMLLNFIAWFGLFLILKSHSSLLAAVDKTMESMEIPPTEGGLEEKLNVFLRESKRYHTAAYAFRAEGVVKQNDLGSNLRKIAELAYQELGATAAELALFDEQSGQWFQAMLIGRPRSVSGQSLLVAAASEGDTVFHEDKRVLVQKLSFAGTLFGALRIELPKGKQASKSDLQVLYLLASQGALMLVDARFTAELLRMREKSEESIKAKTGFLANLSHEIRGPLGIILNASELVIDGLCGPITDSQRETLGMIRKSGDHLLDLVNDVLDYAKVEAGKIIPKPVEMAIAPLLTDLSAVIRSQALAKKHKLTLKEVDSSLGMICDKRHARQMLINFLTNAVKYTHEGGEVSIAAERVSGNRVKISVMDTGIGISDKEKAKVFGAFERVDDEYALAQSGTGLGMPLTRKLAEVNDGNASFSSEEGKGSTFWIMMPAIEIAAAVKDSDAEDSEAGEEPKGNGETILLVDQDTMEREMLERYLVHQGFEIINAASGSEVVKALKDNKVELAVIESEIPNSNGEAMVSVIRGNPKFKGVPIILLSSQAFVFDIERFLKMGVDRCLSKPVELSEIALTARTLIDEIKQLSAQQIAPPPEITP